jgi:hypothetical protein
MSEMGNLYVELEEEIITDIGEEEWNFLTGEEKNKLVDAKYDDKVAEWECRAERAEDMEIDRQIEEGKEAKWELI